MSAVISDDMEVSNVCLNSKTSGDTDAQTDAFKMELNSVTATHDENVLKATLKVYFLRNDIDQKKRPDGIFFFPFLIRKNTVNFFGTHNTGRQDVRCKC